MLTLILVSIVIAVFTYYCVIKPRRYWPSRGVDIGNPLWLFGHTFGAFIQTQTWVDLLEKVYYQSPGARYTGLYHFHFPILVINDPDLLKQVAIKDFDHFTDHMAFLPEDGDPLFAKNLFALQGKKWREMRSLLSPSFTGSKMRAMFSLIVESAETFADYFLKKNEEITVVEMKDVFSRFSTDVIATTACGIKVNSLQEPNNEFYLMGQKAIDFNSFWKNFKVLLYSIAPPIKKVLKIQFFTDDVSSFFRNLIDETIKTRQDKGIVRPDMIHLLLETRKGFDKQEEDRDVTTEQESGNDTTKDKHTRAMSNEDITAQVLVFFLAGFDSVSSLMAFIAYELAINQDIQERLREEVLSTWKACGGHLTYEALLEMKYMDMVISEALRKWPNAILLDRVCTKPYTIEPKLPGEKPIHLKVNDALWVPVYSIHRDPDLYPDPEKFDPERFSEENKSSINPSSFIALGLGPRGCIGSRFALMETKMVIFYILLHFELVPVAKTQIPLKISKKTFTLNAEGGFWLGLKKMKK